MADQVEEVEEVAIESVAFSLTRGNKLRSIKKPTGWNSFLKAVAVSIKFLHLNYFAASMIKILPIALFWREAYAFLPRLPMSHFLQGAPNDNFRKNICSEDDLRSRIFETFVVKFLACLPLLGFSNIQKMVYLPIFNGFVP